MAESGRLSPENSSSKPRSFAQVAGASSSNPINLAFDSKKANLIGTTILKDGRKVLDVSRSEHVRLASAWNHTLIGKFSFAIPSPGSINKGFADLNLKGPFNWSFSTSSHIIMKFDLEEDYQKIWMGTIWSFGDCPMRVFKWTPSFNPKEEVPIAPVWIRLPGLPIQFFDYHALYTICKEIGNPLQVDYPTARKTRLSFARVCVELNLLKDRLQEIVLQFDGVVHEQRIVYEKVPSYCSFCKHVGHGIEDCYMNGNKPKPPPPVRRPQQVRKEGENRTPAAPMEDMGSMKKTAPHSTQVFGSNYGPSVTDPAQQMLFWKEVKKGNPKSTGFLPQSVLEDAAVKSNHIYFNEMFDSTSNQFNILDKLAPEPLDGDSKVGNYEDEILNQDNSKIIKKGDDACGTKSVHIRRKKKKRPQTCLEGFADDERNFGSDCEDIGTDSEDFEMEDRLDINLEATDKENRDGGSKKYACKSSQKFRKFHILRNSSDDGSTLGDKVDLDKDAEFVGLEEDKGPINMEGINCGTLTYEKNKGYDIAMHGNYLDAQSPLISCNRLAPNFLDGRVQNSWELSMISNKSNWTSNGELKLRADKEKLKIMHKDNDGDMHGNDGDMHGNDLQLTHHPNLVGSTFLRKNYMPHLTSASCDQLKEGPVGLDPLLGPQRPTSAPSLSHDHFSSSGSILHGPAPQPTSPSSGQPMMEVSSPSALGSMGPIASGLPLFGLPLNQAHSSGSSINGQQHLRLYEMDKKDGPHSIQAQHQSKGEDGLDPSSTSSIRSPGPLVDGHMQGERGHVDLHSQMEIHSKEHRPVGINPDNISKIGKIHKVVKKSDKKIGNDKFSMTTRSNAKAGKLVHNFLTKGGGSRGLNNSSSHSGNH